MGVKNRRKVRRVSTKTVDSGEYNPFAVFKTGPGRPSLDETYLRTRRDALIWNIEPLWHYIGRSLQAARELEDVRKAFEVVTAGGKHADQLTPVLRLSSEPATAAQLALTRTKLGNANKELYKKTEECRVAAEHYEDCDRMAFVLSEEFKRRLDTDLASRLENVRSIKIQITNLTGKIHGMELRRKRAGQSLETEELSKLRDELCKLEKDREADEKVCHQLKDRIATITPDNRKIVTEELAKRKQSFDAAKQARDSANIEQETILQTLLNQEAFYFRQQILDFICESRYGLTPRNLANAIAGLPYVTSRRSAEICAKLENDLEPFRNYRVFLFVKQVLNRHQKQGRIALIQLFEREIRDLPKFVLAGRSPDAVGKNKATRKKRPNDFRAYLAENWYYLKRAIKEGLRQKLDASDVPYVVTAKYLEDLESPETPVEPILAGKDRITD